MNPTDTFKCVHYSCTLTRAACMRRQGLRLVTITRDRNNAKGSSLAEFDPYCANSCPQGREVAAEHPDLVQLKVTRNFALTTL